jgi:predicted RNA binding protein YcfA (HicA-like mRNA interferase family)
MPKLPGINHQRAVKAFKKAGFWIARQGKHITMTNGATRSVHRTKEGRNETTD